MDLLSKVIDYENSVFEEYLSKRKKLLEHLKTIKSLNKSQANVFIHDLKSIIDPIKTSISEIDHYFTNTDFKKTDNIDSYKKMNEFLYLFLLLYSFSELDETDISEASESSLSENSDSLSESSSSRSVSVTCSSSTSQM